MGAYFLRDHVQVASGTFDTFIRPGDSGAKLSIYFCPTCGSIFWERDTSSDYLGLRLCVLPIPGFIWRL